MLISLISTSCKIFPISFCNFQMVQETKMAQEANENQPQSTAGEDHLIMQEEQLRRIENEVGNKFQTE